jgi:GDPmannose 4,6-dehydratase
LRGQEFVTRKITNSVAKISLGQQDVLELGNMNAKRDWGYAKDYVEGMHLMLQAEKPDTYVLATNRTETVRDFVTMSCKASDIEIEWKGSGENEVAINVSSGKEIIRVNPNFYRPAEVELLIGNSEKAKKDLGWEPSTTLEQLCAMMVEADLRRNSAGHSF